MRRWWRKLNVAAVAAVSMLLTAVPASGDTMPAAGSLDQLVAVVADRLDTADAVAAAKWASSAPAPVIDDPAREAQVYDGMAQLGAARELPEDWVRQVFYGQIEASKMVQRGLVARWQFDPAAAPTEPPDLSTVRPEIDRMNTEIVDHLSARRAELSGPGCVERLAHSVFGLLATGRGDALHRIALVRATTVLCR